MNIQSFTNVARCVGQYLNKPDLAVIGGYHGGNLGDMALGSGIVIPAEKMGLQAGLQMIYNLEKWSEVSPAIVGGGAITYRDCLDRLWSRYQNNPKSLAMVGIDFEDWEAVSDHGDFIKSLAYVSTRSEEQAARANELLNTDIVQFHPDIAFSLVPPLKKMPITNGRRLIINVTPRYHLAGPGQIFNELEEPLKMSFMAGRYGEFCRRVCEVALQSGYQVDHVPFTPSDTKAAEIIFAGLPVKMLSYSPSPSKIMQLMSTYDAFFPSRYHSTIFSLLLDSSCLPFTYAKKCVRLLKEMGVHENNYVTNADLLDKATYERKADSIAEGFIVDKNIVQEFQSRSTAAVATALAAVTRAIKN